MSILNHTEHNFDIIVGDITRRIDVSIDESVNWNFNKPKMIDNITQGLLGLKISEWSQTNIFKVLNNLAPDAHKKRLMSICVNQAGDIKTTIIYNLSIYIYSPTKIYPAWGINISPKQEYAELFQQVMMCMMEEIGDQYGYRTCLSTGLNRIISVI